MNLSPFEEIVKSRLSPNISFKNNFKNNGKQGRPKKEIYEYLIFDELDYNEFLKIEIIDGKEYLIDNEKRLYDITTEEYIGISPF